MTQFVNQRSNDELLLRCSCGGNHFLSFTRGVYEYGDDEPWGYVYVIAEYRHDRGLRNRMANAWRALRGGCRWIVDVQLTDQDMGLLRAWCDRALTAFSITIPQEEEE